MSEYQEIFHTIQPERSVFEKLPKRKEVLKSLKKKPHFDCVIVGGGIHGAAFARDAAFVGLRVLLLEREDYGCRSGLEIIPWGLDSQSTNKDRDYFISIASHRIALSTYELGEGFSWWKRFRQSFKNWIHHTKAEKHLLQFGIVRGDRLANDLILAARQEGAYCLNHARFESSKHELNNKVSVGFTDLTTGEHHTCTAGIVVNCAGLLAKSIGRLKEENFDKVLHVILIELSRPLNSHGIISDIDGYLFVQPFKVDNTLVQFSHEISGDFRETEDTLASTIDTILSKVNATRRDVVSVKSGLQAKGRAQWDYAHGMLTLSGGTISSCFRTTFRGIQKVFKLANSKNVILHKLNHRLPGVLPEPSSQGKLRSLCEEKGLENSYADKAVERLGSRIEILCEDPTLVERVVPGVLLGEVRIAVEIDEALTLEDLCRRRIDIEQKLNEEGVATISEAARKFAQNQSFWERSIRDYQKKIIEEKQTLERVRYSKISEIL